MGGKILKPKCEHLSYYATGKGARGYGVKCAICGHEWDSENEKIERQMGNINTGTFKIYGKEQTNSQESAV